ncbi:hypothetical protein LXD69_06330 [Flavobacterium sediminilitoris]|uniref:Lipoprotein n=1 Tax=Flavobacterium sediminilitoris TaxID=2024526 RepID=A0ABY4HQF6_9FLAO|nr:MULTISPECIES: hypothetical protein [Flavobacterium]UOX35126.1 hypothetical protein LXD69_06330 [Flavobacterium sediminilitoris]
MKRIFFLLSLFLILNSCSVDEGERYHLDFLPIEEVDMPDSFQRGEIYNIKVKYKRPTTCYAYNGIYFDRELNTRTFAIQAVVYEKNDCQNIVDPILLEAAFNFEVLNSGSYIFKFWQGKDDGGEDVFYEVEIPVTD